MKKVYILTLILACCFAGNSFANNIKIPKNAKIVGVILVEGYPTCNTVKPNKSVPADPHLIYDGSKQILNIFYSEANGGMFSKNKWINSNPDKIKYGFKAVKIDSAYFDAVPPDYTFPIDLFTNIKDAVLKILGSKKKYSIKFINSEMDLTPYLNRPVGEIASDIFSKDQIDAILFINYTPTKNVWKRRRVTTGGYRYSWPYTEDGLNLDISFALYLPDDIRQPGINRKAIEIEKGKMDNNEMVEKAMKKLEKKIKYLF